MAAAARLRRSLANWIFRIRVPESPPVTLVQRRVYILPSRQGLFFAAVLAILLLASINYALSLGFVLTFLLASMGFVALHHTWGNLAYLKVRPTRTEPVFAGEVARFGVSLESPSGRARYAIAVGREPAGSAVAIDVPGRHPAVATLAVEAPRRGRLACGRLTLSTTYPVGLFRAWAYVDFGQTALVYPAPATASPEPPAWSRAEGEDGMVVAGEDDFRMLRAYRPGDPPRQVAWRALARGQPLQTKEFQSLAARELWLDWADAPAAGVEARLSVLCRWVLQAEQRGQQYGLRLPGVAIPPAHGEAHRTRCLEALALFGVESPA